MFSLTNNNVDFNTLYRVSIVARPMQPLKIYNQITKVKMRSL